MSAIAISANVTGAGTMTIAAPSTGSNFTLTLPAATGTLAISNQPTVNVFTSGSGTYTTPANCKAIQVRMVGGGGSGGVHTADGGTGGTTTFGTAFLSAGGGTGGTGTTPQAAGIGVASGSDVNINGAAGGSGIGGATPALAGSGGSSPFGGAGGGANPNYTTGTSATTNSGSGGGGGSATTARNGGNSGGYLEKFISSPNATYSYAVGAGGTAPSGAGGGGSGLIIVFEFYV